MKTAMKQGANASWSSARETPAAAVPVAPVAATIFDSDPYHR